ncbi:PHP domain-containing protein [Desulfonatronum sp. SC1]|uniref:PHP domain-containing protein n=1 Tax=Desulfonatronum sp. SC1 TaxID=2109626 RepID=UPI000D30EF80|nr:PHP domain-containing protein [Desulfonatronum sp. SC1]PTN38732.1 hypothetical protein C6366_02015 [Desulfonatronum sp. SC1]
MRIDCHFHTSPHSRCSLVSPKTACEVAVSRGLDALLFTEHGVYWDQDSLDALQSANPKLKLYTGIEIELTEGYHVVAFGARLLDRSVPPLSLSELNRLVAPERDNTFLFVAHAFRYQPYSTPELEQILGCCDGMEMRSINILRDHAVAHPTKLVSADHALYEHSLQAYNLIPVYNSDGHDEDSIGLISNELTGVSPPSDETALARLFKSSHPVELQDRQRLARHALLGLNL